MARLPWAARLYIAGVMLAGAALLLVKLPRIQVDQPGVFVVLLAISLAMTVLKVHLPLPGSGSTMSLSYAVDFASLLLLGPDPTLVVAGTSVFLQCEMNTRSRTPLHRTLFSMAAVVLTVEGTGAVMRALVSASGSAEPVLFVLVTFAVATTYFILNTGLIAGAVALSSAEGIGVVWQRNFLWSAPSYFISAMVAAMATRLVGHFAFWLVPAGLVPLYFTYCAYKVYLGRIEDEQRQVKDAAHLHLATVEALARAIDARDQPSSTHLQRVQHYATGLARAAGLSEPEVQAVKTAALLHDIGKLAIPEHILSKPGRLTEEEFNRVRIHPEVGAEIIADVPFPSPVAPMILGHHERWDGKGYPRGLAGEDIPIGARIISVVDHFQAVTADRPYHAALPIEGAIQLIKAEAGHALDPRLVSTFVDALPSMLVDDAGALPAPAAARSISTALQRGQSLGSGLSVPQNAYEHIATAHREINALYEIAQAMNTSMGVSGTVEMICSKLMKIVPWSGCAVFLYNPSSEQLKCVFGAGVDAATLTGVSMSLDQGLCGWVARNRRTLVNANPAITFQAVNIERTLLNSAIVCPLINNDTLIGVLSLFHVDPDRYTDEHRRLLERVVDQAGTVLHNAIVFEQTQEDALTDPLTGLPNRRSMSAHFARELARAERSNSEFAIVVIDVDGFKTINDTHGHTAGDAALREVARALSSHLRPYDLCGRYAGDEFILILADCSHEAAERRRREVRQLISDIRLRTGPDTVIALSGSAGAAVFPHDGITYDSLIAVADRRMYDDKTQRASGEPDFAESLSALSA